MDIDILPLPKLERISSSYSSSTCNSSTSPNVLPESMKVLEEQQISDFDDRYDQLLSPATPSNSPQSMMTRSPVPTTRKRKRKSSIMIIKPTRWSPPLQCNQKMSGSNSINHHPTTTAVDTDFKPSFYNPNEIKHRRRISSQQCEVLEAEYQNNIKPNATKRHQLAERLGMTPRTVQIWFQNKRAKAKQQRHQRQHHHHHQENRSSPSTEISSPSSPSSSSPSSSSSSSYSLSSLATNSLDIMTFDDGRLDPIYLVDNCDMTTAEYQTTKNGILWHSNDDTKNTNAVVAPMMTPSGSGMMDDHGTIKSSSPLSSTIPFSASKSGTFGTCDAFRTWLYPTSNVIHPYNETMKTNELLFAHSTTSTAPSSLSSSPLQQYASLNSKSSQMHQSESHDNDHCLNNNDTNNNTIISWNNGLHNDKDDDDMSSFVLNWMQKSSNNTEADSFMTPMWPYIMNQQNIQHLPFPLGQDDWTCFPI
ncbi:uncharacterized protein BX664DRAFT_288391 [Halteromyces radiatus]|uniref:uncharacterized protein n=1 Tax=Halteromyces radiatus TaxID=101107 RepID=UPI0022211DC4|nr:uncharacterized protein BX664DRAFT_288391 [Halteromyces radiatus]KAI8098734.1 hypothetical protein BX664DRAFT_288391 [Halteromyces radiatus]